MLVRNRRAVITHIIYALPLIDIRVAPLNERREVLDGVPRLIQRFVIGAGEWE